MTLGKFIAAERLDLAKCEHLGLQAGTAEWPQSHHAYSLLLRKDKDDTLTMALPWRQGTGIVGPPKLCDVVDCLASDAATVENAPTFEDWAAELGFDPDSRKDERTFKQCQEQSERLRELLGDDAYETLIWKVERA